MRKFISEYGFLYRLSIVTNHLSRTVSEIGLRLVAGGKTWFLPIHPSSPSNMTKLSFEFRLTLGPPSRGRINLLISENTFRLFQYNPPTL